MKTARWIQLAAAFAIATTLTVSAQDGNKPARPNREEARGRLQNLTPEERAARLKEMREKNPEAAAGFERRAEEMKKFVKELGLNQDELQKLSPEERRAKVKEAADKKTAELEKKKAAGTLTDADKETMRMLEQRKRMLEGGRYGGQGRGERDQKPATKPEAK